MEEQRPMYADSVGKDVINVCVENFCPTNRKLAGSLGREVMFSGLRKTTNIFIDVFL